MFSAMPDPTDTRRLRAATRDARGTSCYLSPHARGAGRAARLAGRAADARRGGARVGRSGGARPRAAATEALDAPTPAAGPDADPALNQLAAAYPQLDRRERRRARGPARAADRRRRRPVRRRLSGRGPGAQRRERALLRLLGQRAGIARRTRPRPTPTGDGDVPTTSTRSSRSPSTPTRSRSRPGRWAGQPPKPDTSGCGADPATRSDVYLKQLGNQRLFGYESPDPGQGGIRSQYGYMVLDNDYAKAEYGYADPLRSGQRHGRPRVQPPAAAELRQLPGRVDVRVDRGLGRGAGLSRTINDYLNYVADFAAKPRQPITDRQRRRRLKIYGAAVWNHWLDSAAAGTGTRRDPPALGGLRLDQPGRLRGRRLRPGDPQRAAGEGFSREFARFAAATAEWRTGFGGFPDATGLSGREAQGQRCNAARSSASGSTTPPIVCSACSRAPATG